jgi:carbon-monoxide dehydrogenase large subunit
MSTRYVGARVPRKEDPALLTGHGRYVADLAPHGTVHAAFVRSPLAHARITAIDTTAAAALPGVLAVYTARDLPAPLADKALPLLVPNPAIRRAYTQRPLATDEVCFVGEAVAVVLAEDPYIAEDATELVEVDYEELSAVPDIDTAVRGCAGGAALTHADATDNVGARFTVGYGEVDAAFANCAHVARDVLRMNRGSAQSMECRGVVAVPDPDTGRLTVHSATQAPHLVKRSLMDMLELDSEAVTVIAPPDVGGGFGPKVIVYPEEIVVPALAQLHGRPMRWIEDRREHFMATTQERNQLWELEVALTEDGRILGLRGTMRHDAGAYFPWGIVMPYIAATTAPGPYVVPSYRLDVDVMLTNAVPTTPVRGAGRPQAVFAMERLLDHAAAELGIDRAEIRRRNLIGPERMPYAVGLTFRDGKPIVYDSGDYPATLAAALDKIDYVGFDQRRRAAAQQGRLLGIGMACYVEGTGLGPFEGVSVRIERNGRVTVHTAAAPQGQSHQTTLAQVVADQLGVDIGAVTVRTGDTSTAPEGVGTFASRIMVTAGSSAHAAGAQVREKVVKLAANLLEVDESDIELVDGTARVRGAPDTALGFGQLARASQGVPGFSLAPGQTAGLYASAAFTPAQATYAHGAHAAEVEVDVDTGAVHIQRYVVAHDCGRVINPMVVDGQVQGGVAHGVGNALLEATLFDENAQPITVTFADYLLPEAGDVPEAEVVHLESPTPLNPLGAKGAGEGGTIPAPAAIVSAVEDALRDRQPRITHHPISPAYLHSLLAAPAKEPPAEPLSGPSSVADSREKQ